MIPGYSGRPVHAKLGITAGLRVALVNAPDNYTALLEKPPAGVQYITSPKRPVDMVHVFSTSRRDLVRRLPRLLANIRNNGVIWVSWPKRSSNVATDITEDTIREVAFPLGLVDVKVCAVSEVWSGLKLVIRRENRK